jgi:hypothetical protein
MLRSGLLDDTTRARCKDFAFAHSSTLVCGSGRSRVVSVIWRCACQRNRECATPRTNLPAPFSEWISIRWFVGLCKRSRHHHLTDWIEDEVWHSPAHRITLSRILLAACVHIADTRVAMIQDKVQNGIPT